MEEKKGHIAEIVFHNDENGYSVIIFETEEEQFTAVGTLPVCRKGAAFLLKGGFVVHAVYGEQFKFSEAEEMMPENEEEIAEFLSSGVIKGIRRKTALRIVDVFGKDTLDILENDPDRLSEVPGIGDKKLNDIKKSYSAHREFARIAMQLKKYDISAGYAMKLYKAYKEDTIKILEENPYRLVDDVYGIGFRKADNIAKKIGIDPEDEFRIRSGIMYTLNYFSSEGNVFLPETYLCEKTAELLDVSTALVSETLFTLAIEGDVRVDVIDDRKVVYPFYLYQAEVNVAQKLLILEDADIKSLRVDPRVLTDMMARDMGMSLSEKQRYAIMSSVQSGVSVITGGPGTGKTTIINIIIRILEESGLNVAIAAPTGRAAKRITETSGHDASTIHRLLEYTFGEEDDVMYFGKNEEDPLDFDAVIVDEASMIDLVLMNALVSAIRPGSRLVIVGDSDQLPSVGAGNVLRDIIESEIFQGERLDEIFRQAKESLTVVNAHRINKGEYPFFNEKGKDFFLVRRSSEKEIVESVKELCCKRLPAFYDELVPNRDIQVLTPVKKNILGSRNLNKELQEVINPPAAGLEEKTFGERIFRVNDKVMQIRNNYELGWKNSNDGSEGQGVFNGDIGFVSSINKEYGVMTVVFDDVRYVNYDFSNLDELELAYAVTVHKSQGSEFPVIVMPVSWFPPVLATRNLFYTAITRGKKAVVLVGSENKMNAMVDNNRISQRYSGLKYRLKAGMDGMESDQNDQKTKKNI